MVRGTVSPGSDSPRDFQSSLSTDSLATTRCEKHRAGEVLLDNAFVPIEGCPRQEPNSKAKATIQAERLRQQFGVIGAWARKRLGRPPEESFAQDSGVKSGLNLC